MIWGGSLNALLAASDCLELKCLQAIGENIEKVINLFPLVFLVLQKSHVVVVIVFFFLSTAARLDLNISPKLHHAFSLHPHTSRQSCV